MVPAGPIAAFHLAQEAVEEDPSGLSLIYPLVGYRRAHGTGERLKVQEEPKEVVLGRHVS